MSRRSWLLARGAMQRNQRWDSPDHHYRIQKWPSASEIAAFAAERRASAKDTKARQTKTQRNSWWSR